ncbi:MAG: M20 family metallopeptidase [Candidatus Freyarchaeota archaeon]
MSWEQVQKHLKEDEIIKLTQELVRIPSSKDVKGGERKVAETLASFFEKYGIPSEIQRVGLGANIVARIGDPDAGPTLMLNGHLDTVLATNMTIPPYEPVIRGGKLYGRGSCDMKAALAAMVAALAALHKAGVKLKGSLLFTGVSGEETGSAGARRIVERGPTSNCAIVGEPTNLVITHGGYGITFATINIRGKAAHGSTPHEGINAIEKAAKIIVRMREKLPKIFAERTDPVVGPPTYNVGIIKSGTQPNIVPDKCTLVIDREVVPGETLEQIIADFQGIIDELREEDPELDATVAVPAVDLQPLKTSLDYPFIKHLAQATQHILGRVEYTGRCGSTDAAIFSEAGIPSVIFGPGEIKVAHSEAEYVEVEQVVNAAKIYTLTALNYLT